MSEKDDRRARPNLTGICAKINDNFRTTTMTIGWAYRPVGEIVAGYEKSLQEYRNIRTDEDFKGYDRTPAAT